MTRFVAHRVIRGTAGITDGWVPPFGTMEARDFFFTMADQRTPPFETRGEFTLELTPETAILRHEGREYRFAQARCRVYDFDGGTVVNYLYHMAPGGLVPIALQDGRRAMINPIRLTPGNPGRILWMLDARVIE
jgi:hypothetical protein